MAKDQAVYFLSEESLEALEGSKGAIVLIQFPKDIEELKGLISDLQSERKSIVEQLEPTQKGYEDLFKLTFKQKLFKGKQIKQEKAELAEKIGKMARAIASIDSKIGEYESGIKHLSEEYDKFVKVLLTANIEPQAVIDEYNRIKDMLEKKARGEWVEPQAAEPVEVVAEEPKKAESVAIPAQNLKKNPRLSQKEKFERRLALTAQKKSAAEHTGRQPE